MKTLLASCALLLASFCSSAATYTYTGVPYAAVNNFTLCATGSCGNFTTSMQINASFTTAAPLPANLVATDITALITGGSSNDGLTTYLSTNPNLRVYQFVVSTDSRGIITFYDIVIERWQSGAAPHVVGDRVDYFQVSSLGATGVRNIDCTAVGVGPAGQADTCLGAVGDTSTSQAVAAASAFGFVAAPAVGLAAVPTLGEWGLVLLAMLMAAAGVGGLRGRARAG